MNYFFIMGKLFNVIKINKASVNELLPRLYLVNSVAALAHVYLLVASLPFYLHTACYVC